jgi:3-oxoacyl-[acyl-carrier protein] reductase
MKFDFSNKTALITGATRGIGKAIADCMYIAGANLILTGTNQNEIYQFNKLNQEKGINNIQFIQVDFSKADSTKLFLERIEEFPKIDICINNAGVNKVNNFVETSYVDLKWSNNININAPYQVLKVVGPKMIKQNYGRIVNIASIWSVITRPGRSMYTLSKNALVGLTKTLAVEWASNNVLVNAVSPGFTLTELTKSTNSLEQLEAIKRDIPIKRMADPDEIAKTVVFLCSNLNTYLTGQNIIVDGGYTNV